VSSRPGAAGGTSFARQSAKFHFMINTDYQMLDLLPEEEFGPFEGSMYIGGATL